MRTRGRRADASRVSLLGLAVLLAGCSPPDQRSPRRDDGSPAVVVETRPPPLFVHQVDAALGPVDGPVGVSVYSFSDGWRLDRGCGRRLPQQSVSKLWVAATVFDAIDGGRLRLYDQVLVTRADLTLFHQPIVALVGPDGYRTTVLDLLIRAMTQSDNTANDRLLTLVGGPDAVRAFLRRRNVDGVGFGPGERLLQSGTAGMTWGQSLSSPWMFQNVREKLPASVRLAAYREYVASPPDGATACGIVDGLAKLRDGKLLSVASTQTLLSIMGASVTGRARLRAGLPQGWLISHKTGTGQEYAGRVAGFNDVGIVTSPDGKAYAVAVLIGDSGSRERSRQGLIRSVAQAIVDQHTRELSGF